MSASKASKDAININIKGLTDKIDNFIEEYYKNPVNVFTVNDIKKIELVNNIIDNIVRKRSAKYEIEKYNKIIIENTEEGKGCIKREYKIKKVIGKEKFSAKKFITKNNKLLILKKIYFYEKNSIKKYDDMIKSYNIMYKSNISPKLLDSYICCNNQYDECYMVFVLEYPTDYILLSDYVKKPNIKNKDIEDIKNTLYEMNKNITKKNILLSDWFEMDDVMISQRDKKSLKYIVLNDVSNFNETIEEKLSKFKRNLKWTIRKNNENYVEINDDTVGVYVSKRLLDNNLINIEL